MPPGLSRFKLGVGMQAHSGWIKTLSENGIPGVVLLFGFSLSYAAVGWRLRADGVLPFCLTISLILAIAFISTEFQAKGLWLLAAMGTLELRRAGARGGIGGKDAWEGRGRRRAEDEDKR